LSLLIKCVRQDLQKSDKTFEITREALKEYQRDLVQVEALLDRKARTLEVQLAEQPSWLMYYSERKAHLHALVRFFSMKLEERKSHLWRHYTEDYKRELTSTDKERYIDGEESYILLIEMLLEAKEVFEEFDSAVEAFKSQGYALSSLARLRASEARTNPDL